MPYSLDELAKDIKGILKDHGIQEGSDKVCYYVCLLYTSPSPRDE